MRCLMPPLGAGGAEFEFVEFPILYKRFDFVVLIHDSFRKRKSTPSSPPRVKDGLVATLTSAGADRFVSEMESHSKRRKVSDIQTNTVPALQTVQITSDSVVRVPSHAF
jgi:hypothetical protein